MLNQENNIFRDKEKEMGAANIYIPFFFPVASLPAAFFLPTGGLKAVSVGKATW